MHNLTAVSGLDDLLYDVTLTDASTSAPLDVAVAGTVSVSLCRLNTEVLGWQGAGRWTAVQDDTNILAALTAGGVVVGQKFDLILTIGTLGVRKLSTCQRVAILDLVP
jgi:hypothetical protein